MSDMALERPVVPRLEGFSRSGSPLRDSSRSPRRVPSPLRHAEFRPLAMEYAASPSAPTSCKYYNKSADEEDEEPTFVPGGYCSTVRTVGYSTVGGKAFMSGKCPHCKRMVKSDTQVCTPNATPPPSPWIAGLQSPLRSPIRSPKTPGEQTRLQSPLRSPFKGSFFNSVEDKSGNNAPASPKSATAVPRARSPRSPGPRTGSVSPRGRSTTPRERTQHSLRSSVLSPRARSQEPPQSCSRIPRTRSPGPVVITSCTPGGSTRGPRSPGPRSPLHSPWKGASFFEGSASDEETSRKAVLKSRGAHSPGPRSPLTPLKVKVDVTDDMEEEESWAMAAAAAATAETSAPSTRSEGKSGWKSPLRSPFKGSVFGRKNKGGGVGTE